MASLAPVAIDSVRTARKARGAYFTPETIADFLTAWAIRDDEQANVLDPACGDGAFLRAAAKELERLAGGTACRPPLTGIDVDGETLEKAEALLTAQGVRAQLVRTDFLSVPSPNDGLSTLPLFDAVVGNPPYVRYQHHSGEARQRGLEASLRQGVRLSGLASSWAPILIHSAAFLKPSGRLAMVLPAELLSVNYAEPVRRWLRERFSEVNLVMFERLQFADALENVVLLLASGRGGCDAFSLYHVRDAADLARIRPLDGQAVAPPTSDRWTELLLSSEQRQLFRKVTDLGGVRLDNFGTLDLGTVTGANGYFTMPDSIRSSLDLVEGDHVNRVCPPGTRHLRGLAFTRSDWESLRKNGDPVWLLNPAPDDLSDALQRYVRMGEQSGVHRAYKCRIRKPWWKPPVVAPPDLFFTYMSHHYPRLIRNAARVTYVNSMHGLRLNALVAANVADALPLLAMNSMTMIGAEIQGRSYGGGILKMEPSEAARLPVPSRQVLDEAWQALKPARDSLDRTLRGGHWTSVVAKVDEVLFRDVLGLAPDECEGLTSAAASLRLRRLKRGARDTD